MTIDKEMLDRLSCDNARKLTPDDLYKHITEAVRPSMPCLAHPGEPLEVFELIDVFDLLDYGQRSVFCRWEKLGDIEFIDNWRRVVAVPSMGGNEGAYLDVSLETVDPDKHDPVTKRTLSLKTPLFTFKTLGEGPDACAAMGLLGGIITYAVEMFLEFNLHEEEGGK